MLYQPASGNGQIDIHYMSATTRENPAEPSLIFTGKQDTVNPVAGRTSKFASFSIWQ